MKKLLLVYSLIPLIWVIAFMSLVHYKSHPYGGTLENCLGYVAYFFCYYGIGFIIWAALLIFMKVKKRISTREMVINIVLVVIAVSLLYSCFKFNVFNLSDYLD
ncbi:MAG TPA: hypothetical protein VK806_02785 [Bacteroidia bacterium]|nr:hypothetical protein [Bacteroidia bacterium]